MTNNVHIEKRDKKAKLIGWKEAPLLIFLLAIF